MAAESCDWTDDVTYTCTLKDGLQFSDGDDLTAEDVVFSIERQLTIQHESGGWTLLGAVNPDNGGSVERSEEHTSELQSRENLVCRLLLEKKKKRQKSQTHT